jgi:hypothetical protein
MGATTVEEKLSRPRALLRNQSGGDGPRPAKLPYGGLNRIRFEGCVSTIAEPARYPRFGVHFTMHGGREPATVLAAPPAAGLARRSLLRCSCLHGNHQRQRSKPRSTKPRPDARDGSTRKSPAPSSPVTHSFERNFREAISCATNTRDTTYEVWRYAAREWLTPAGSTCFPAGMTQRNNHSPIAIAKPKGQAVVLRAGLITLATLALITVLVLITGSTSAGYGFA